MATSNLKLLCSKLCRMSINNVSIRTYIPPRYRPPYWYMPKERVYSDENLTLDNKQFIEEMMQDRLKAQEALESPLTEHKVIANVQWNPMTRRVGLIARKIGNYPLWTKDGKRKLTTLLQVIDNHVIKYTPPEEFNPMIMKKMTWREKQNYGCLLVGAETIDSSKVTKDYCGLFNSVGMLPKRHLCRFIVSPNASLPSGTPLFATHFRVGDHIDVRGLTVYRGFQGVMKRWGFKGMPASHGVTKTHRRPGNIGAGGQKARVWPGTKMPGHMGNRWRVNRGVKILRINTKYNVIWTQGVSIPGETGGMCYLYDTILPLKKHSEQSHPPFPTYIPSESDELPIEYYDESVHQFENSSIAFEES